MDIRRTLPPGRQKYLLAFMFVVVVSVISVSFSIGNGEAYDPARREILLRKIGDELLLQSGDRTSRVMPVKKVGENEFQVSFERDLSFQPDSLVNIVRRVLGSDAPAYIVNVVNCGSSSVAYGFAISKDQKNDIIACKGRLQPKACYHVNIKFEAAKTKITGNAYLVGGLALLPLIGFVALRLRNKQNVAEENLVKPNAIQENQPTHRFALGSIMFDAQSRKLVVNEKITDLTEKENRVLLILASSPNTIIERNRLQKEIWEDEGVIVGRSLDMFISKLRKKLEIDPNVKIEVVRGKGYKLIFSR